MKVTFLSLSSIISIFLKMEIYSVDWIVNNSLHSVYFWGIFSVSVGINTRFSFIIFELLFSLKHGTLGEFWKNKQESHAKYKLDIQNLFTMRNTYKKILNCFILTKSW